MSSKTRILAIALVLFFTIGLWAAMSKADVTGSFEIHLSFAPIPCMYIDNVFGTNTLFPDQPCEKTLFKIDFQTAIDINIAISGLTIGLHSHAGVTGFEDIILSFATTLGALEISDTFVFGQPYAFVIIDENGDGDWSDTWDEAFPTCLTSEADNPDTLWVESNSCLTLFVKKRVEMTIALGGVTFSNLAMFEDVNFPNCGLLSGYSVTTGFCVKEKVGRGGVITPGITGGIYNTEHQLFGFGDVITLEGQTPSGITVTSETGICAQQSWNHIKKHRWYFTVNPDCVPGYAFSHEVTFTNSVTMGGTVPPDVTTPVVERLGNVEVSETIDYTAAGATWAVNDTIKKTFRFRLIGTSEVRVLYLLLAADDVTVGENCPDPIIVTAAAPTTSCDVTLTIAAGASGSASATIAFTTLPEPLSKSPFLFDFEKLWVTGIPLAAGLTLDLYVECNLPYGLLCGFYQTWNITGGPIFNSISVYTGFQGLPLGASGTAFADIIVRASGGPLSLVVIVDPTDLLVDCWAATASFTINPDTNPASLRIRATSDPFAYAGYFCTYIYSGPAYNLPLYNSPALSFMDFALTITRAGLSFTADVDFDVSSAEPETFNFQDLTLTLSADAGIVNIKASIIYKEQKSSPAEEAFLLGGDLYFTVKF